MTRCPPRKNGLLPGYAHTVDPRSGGGHNHRSYFIVLGMVLGTHPDDVARTPRRRRVAPTRDPPRRDLRACSSNCSRGFTVRSAESSHHSPAHSHPVPSRRRTHKTLFRRQTVPKWLSSTLRYAHHLTRAHFFLPRRERLARCGRAKLTQRTPRRRGGMSARRAKRTVVMPPCTAHRRGSATARCLRSRLRCGATA